MSSSIKRRMVIGFTLSYALIWVLIAGLLLANTLKQERGSFDRGIAFSARALSDLLRQERNPQRQREIAATVAALDRTLNNLDRPQDVPNLNRYQVFTLNGGLVYKSDEAPETPMGAWVSGYSDLSGPEPMRVFTQHLPEGGLWIKVAEPIRYRKSMLRAVLVNSLLYNLAILVGVAWALTWLLTWISLRPLHRLADQVSRRKPLEHKPLVDPGDLKEARPLVKAINSLLERSADLLDAQRRLVGDAAHELKTPLAVVGAQAYVLLKAETPEARQAAAADLRAGVDRAANLVRQLLQSARTDTLVPQARLRVDLAALAASRVAELVPVALLRHQDLGIETLAHPVVLGDPVVLATVVDNLVENALRYSQDGATITVRIAQQAPWALLIVEDDGPGIPKALREHVMERFVRLPGTQPAGSGLGLAIVNNAVKHHGGTLRLEDAVDHATGLRAVVTLPLAEG